VGLQGKPKTGSPNLKKVKQSNQSHPPVEWLPLITQIRGSEALHWWPHDAATQLEVDHNLDCFKGKLQGNQQFYYGN